MEQFIDYFTAMKNADEVIGAYNDEQVYEFCKRKWLERHHGANVPSMPDLLREVSGQCGA